MISCGVHPLSAMSLLPPLRSPCGTQVFGNPASSHHLRNCVLKPFLLNGRPHSLTKKVRDSDGLGQASIAAVSDAGIGISTFCSFRLRFFSCVKTNQPFLRC